MKKIINKIKKYILNWKIQKYNHYCELCSSCGEEGCCSPMMCMHKCMIVERPKKCKYGSSYYNDIKFSYLLNREYEEEIYKLKEKKITTEQFLENVEKKWHEIYDIVYENEINRKPLTVTLPATNIC
jgi:hypothetical protein